MDIRNQNTLDATIPESKVNHTWKAALNQKRMQLIKVLHTCDAFDANTIEAFDLSRQANGSYQINGGDPLLINNVKSIINVLVQLEYLFDKLAVHIGGYIQADNTISLLWNLGNAVIEGAIIWSTGRLGEIEQDISNLAFYLQELTANLSSLPQTDSSLAPLIADLKKTLRSSIEPAMRQINALQNKTDNMLGEVAADRFVEAAEVIQEALEEPGARAVAEKMSKTKKNWASKINQLLDDIQGKINKLIDENAETKKDEKTNLYAITKDNNDYINTLMRASNSIVKFKSALSKIKRTLNFEGVHVISALKNLALAIQDLHDIDTESMKKLSAENLLEISKQLTADINPILIEVGCLIEVSEYRLGLKNDVLQVQFNEVCAGYKKIADTLKVTLNENPPYWQSRLEVRKKELNNKIDKYKALKKAKHKVETTLIDAESSLCELVLLRKAALNIKSPKSSGFLYQLDKMIEERTGQRTLKLEIKQLEKIVKNKNSAQNEIKDACVKLEKLYKIKDAINKRIEKIADTNTDESGRFSYDQATQSIKDVSLPLKKRKQVEPTDRDNIIIAADELMAGVVRDHDYLAQQMEEAENAVIDASERQEKSEKVRFLQALLSRIKNIEPQDLYTHPLNEFEEILRQMQALGEPKAIFKYELIIRTVIDERSLGTEHALLEANVKELTAFREKLKDTKHEFGEDEIEKMAMLLFITEDDLIDNIKYGRSWVGSFANRILGSSLDSLVNQKIQDYTSELNDKNDKKYKGTHLDVWDEARRNLLNVIHNKIADELNSNLPNRIFAGHPESAAPAHRAAEMDISPERIEKRLRDKNIVAKLEMVRDQILNQCPTYLKEDEVSSLIKVNASTGLYDVYLSDSLLLKNTKSLLNLLTKMERIIDILLAKYAAGNDAKSMSDYIKLISKDVYELNAAIREVQLELGDFSHYLAQMRSVYPDSVEAKEMLNFAALSNRISPVFTSVREFIDVPDIDAIDFSDITSGINRTLVALGEMAMPAMEESDTTAEQMADKEFSGLKSAIYALSDYIEKQGISRAGVRRYDPEQAENNADLKNVIILHNALIKLSNTLHQMLNLAEGDTLKGGVKMLANLLKIYNLIKKMDMSRFDQAKLFLKTIFEKLQPLLIAAVVNVEIAELRLGLPHNEKLFGEVAEVFDGVAEKVGCHFNHHYPYLPERIAAFKNERDKELKQIDSLNNLETQIANLMAAETRLSELSLKELVGLRDLLILHPPSKIIPLIDMVNLAIAQTTGLDHVQAKIKSVESQLARVEQSLLVEENYYHSSNSKIKSLQNEQSKLIRIQDDMNLNKHLSMHDIKYLHSIYKSSASMPIEEFCTLLVENSGLITKNISTRLDEVQLELDYQTKNLAKYEQSIAEANNKIAADEKELSRLQHIAAKLTDSVNAVKPDEKFRYDLTSNRVITGESNVVKIESQWGDAQNKKKISELLAYISENTQQLQANKIEKLEAAIARKESIHHDQLKRLHEHSKSYLSALEKDIGITPGMLSNLIKADSVANHQNLRWLFSNLLTQYRLNDTYGIGVNTHTSDTALAKAIRDAAFKQTSLLGRFFRRLINKPSVNDQVYKVASHFSSQCNVDHYVFAHRAIAKQDTQTESRSTQHKPVSGKTVSLYKELGIHSPDNSDQAMDPQSQPKLTKHIEASDASERANKQEPVTTVSPQHRAPGQRS